MTQNIRALVAYRVDQADESLSAARILLKEGLLRPAINRAYYAMFYGVLALLATRTKETSKHSGAIALFDREFVKTGVFTKDLSRRLHDAFDLRQRCDYVSEGHASREEADSTLANAVSFVQEVKRHLGE